ncbi:hypothetical protein K470DRAFT_269594 [Piedraia hortae CBS 480.64]|uniref:Uncharacterized protein n=1 Tax=Piedraia hortae CBS 480.64 TaxID=1314780 RepID=A0A6A7C2H1_9PEZI|nr:hypothetical protein K470DRAFT_269594 [Piedraia hortae CBS 480.64]
MRCSAALLSLAASALAQTSAGDDWESMLMTAMPSSLLVEATGNPDAFISDVSSQLLASTVKTLPGWFKAMPTDAQQYFTMGLEEYIKEHGQGSATTASGAASIADASGSDSTATDSAISDQKTASDITESGKATHSGGKSTESSATASDSEISQTSDGLPAVAAPSSAASAAAPASPMPAVVFALGASLVAGLLAM